MLSIGFIPFCIHWHLFVYFFALQTALSPPFIPFFELLSCHSRGQRSLVCCSLWGHRVSHDFKTEQQLVSVEGVVQGKEIPSPISKMVVGCSSLVFFNLSSRTQLHCGMSLGILAILIYSFVLGSEDGMAGCIVCLIH